MANLIDPLSLLNAIYNSTLDYGIITIDLDGHLTSWNVGAERITGFAAGEAIAHDQALIFTPEDIADMEPQLSMQIACTKGRAEDYRWHMRKDGSRFWAEGVLTSLKDANGAHIGYLKIFRDITDRKQADAEVYRIAHSDMLTGLANRYAFEIQAKQMIAAALRSGQPMALHLIDLDRFKQVNDSFGHHAGDLLLQQAAQRMRGVLRESDYLARLGGDEFALLQPNMEDMQAGGLLAAKLNQELSQPFPLDGRSAQISGSIGISICPCDADNLDHLLKRADLAMYRAKSENHGAYHYYTSQLDKAAHQRSRDVSAIRQAIERKEFWLEYQPKLALGTGKILGIEALLRCSNATLRNHPVDSLIDLAISAGLMQTLSLWVLHTACEQLRQWQDRGFGEFTICVNLCSCDLTDPAIPDVINSILSMSALQSHHLELEITERQALDIEMHGLSVLERLHARGIRLVLDDFGTGYSALSYLTRLPVSAIKLDKSFLEGIPDSAQGSAVVKAVMHLSHALGIDIVAEGVENDRQAAFLEANNCTAIQGFLVTRPLTAEGMGHWLADHGGKRH